MRTTLRTLLVLSLAAPAAAQTNEPAAADLQGKLYRSVFTAGAGALGPADLPSAPEALRPRLERYLARRAAFKSAYTSRPDDMASMRADAKRRALERSLVALVDAPGIEKAAAAFVAAAPIAAEWNGLPDGPLGEAEFAEDLLKKDPASSMAPWFYVFIAERQRIVFEACENQQDEEGMKAAARKYRTFMARARAADDPIFPALAGDVDRRPYLYIKSTNHPRDYDPDS